MLKVKHYMYISICTFLCLTHAAFASTADFLGTWVNPHPRNGLWGQLIITQDSNGALKLARFGACGVQASELCDDGVHALTVYPQINGVVRAGLSSGPSVTTGNVVFANRDLVLNLNLNTGELKVQTFTRFTPNDPRGVYVLVENFRRQ